MRLLSISGDKTNAIATTLHCSSSASSAAADITSKTKMASSARRVPNPRDGYFSMGDHTLSVPLALFAKNRQRLAEALKADKAAPANSVVLLQGGGDQVRTCSMYRTVRPG